jgi:hypothetical protein
MDPRLVWFVGEEDQLGRKGETGEAVFLMFWRILFFLSLILNPPPFYGCFFSNIFSYIDPGINKPAALLDKNLMRYIVSVLKVNYIVLVFVGYSMPGFNPC